MKPKYIIIHHSLTKDQETVDWSAIKKYHIHKKGWDDIGYHFGIELVNRYIVDGITEYAYEILVGRMMNKKGAHCLANGRNNNSLGICFIGNFDKYTPTPSMWNRGIILVKSLMDIFNISKFNVLGHREEAQDGRTCPGKLFDMKQFRNEL